MQHVNSGAENAMDVGVPIASMGATIYAVVTDTFWLGAMTLVATAVGMIIKMYTAYHEVKNKSLEVRVEAMLAAHKKELEEVKSASEDAFSESVDKIKGMYESEQTKAREKNDLALAELTVLIKELKEKVRG